MFQSATWSTSDRQSKVYDPRIHVSMRYSVLNCKRPTLNRVVGQDQHPPQGSHSFRISRIVSHITAPGTDAVIPHRFSSPENPGFEDRFPEFIIKLSQPSRRDLCQDPPSTILYSSRWRPASGSKRVSCLREPDGIAMRTLCSLARGLSLVLSILWTF